MTFYEVTYRIWTDYKVVVDADSQVEATSEVMLNYFEMDDAKAIDGGLDVTGIEPLVENRKED